MAKRVKVGDVFEVSFDDALFYVRFIGKHPIYGDAVEATPQRQRERPHRFDGLFDDAYATFYPVSAAARRGMVVNVGHTESGKPSLPVVWRRAGARSDRTILNWVFEEPDGREVVRSNLSPEERRVPIAAIWNHECLVMRLKEAWRPETEG